ncbi:MAG: rhodanese-like domain-containing protein [Candidatus Melainabacteria bacterium]|nr:rhodanese-like domain-containing protein [Candidatus Melainabacteria bacterium]
MEIKEISVYELKELKDKGEDFCLIDVRNPQEFELCNIDGKLIPMSEIIERHAEIPKDCKVVVHCHHGGRSKKVIDWLQANHGFDKLYNLSGGIHAWSEEIDSTVDQY